LVTYIISNSVATFHYTNYPTFTELLNAKFPISYHSSLFTALGALWQIKNLKFNKDDIIIFNVGINDCIYRKDKSVQKIIFDGLLKEAIVQKDDFSIGILNEKIASLNNKDESDLLQLVTFQEFEKIINEIFIKIKNNKVVVLSIAWFPPNNKRIGWAFQECVKTNHILKNKALEYKFKYIDLWRPPTFTYDGVHLNKEGHVKVAMLINEVIK
jgi:lysophospholipase L1-like esterase